MIKYSESTKGFYDTEINMEIPRDAVEITQAYHAELLTGQAQGKQILADNEGYPRLQDPPAPTLDQLKKVCKREAKQLLIDTDWTQQNDVAGILINKDDFIIYRATVRNLFLRPVPEPEFPEKPEAIWGAQ